MSVITYEPGERPYEKYAGYLDRQGTGCDSWGELTEDDRAAWAEVELPEPYKPDAAPLPAGDALAALAAKWQAEADNADPGLATPRPEASYASRKAAVRQKRICIRQLRQALGVHPLDMAHEDDDDA